jgi:hypothetical protein
VRQRGINDDYIPMTRTGQSSLALQPCPQQPSWLSPAVPPAYQIEWTRAVSIVGLAGRLEGRRGKSHGAVASARVKAHSSGFAAQVNTANRPLTSRFVVSCCPLLSPQIPPSCGPSAAHTGCERSTVALSGVLDSVSNSCSIPCFGGTWHDPALGRPIAAPLERCAELLGVDLATVRELAAKVEPYIRSDGTEIWSLMQLERQLRPEAFGRRRGGYVGPSTNPGHRRVGRGLSEAVYRCLLAAQHDQRSGAAKTA